jgi:serine/threonine protein kinase
MRTHKNKNKFKNINKKSPSTKGKKYTLKNRKSKKGGEVIASGGFGCVFKPSLLCENETIRKPNSVSKLMTTKHALTEHQEINTLSSKLTSIPHYDDFFVLGDISVCKPRPLSDDDLAHFSKKCSALQKVDIDVSNINSQLDNLRMITMPDGGIPVDDYLSLNNNLYAFKHLNKSLMNLFKNGIIPMNNKHVYHNDIKDSNILVQPNNNILHTRLIDWGLSCFYDKSRDNTIPKEWINRPFQYNMPYSIVLFSDLFAEMNRNFYDNTPSPTLNETRDFVDSFATKYFEVRGPGHIYLINKILNILSDTTPTRKSVKKTLNNIDIAANTQHSIINYLSDILHNYISFNVLGTLTLKPYIDQIFTMNVDSWGFVYAYYPALEMLYFNYPSLNATQRSVFKKLKKIFIYANSCVTTPIIKNQILLLLGNINEDLNMETSFTSQSLTPSVSMTSQGITNNTPS